jgi:pilus assembly protein CpaB
MKRKAPLLFLLMAVLLAGAAAWGAHQWMSAQAVQKAGPVHKLAPVVVAIKILPAGHKLKAADLALQQWPVANLPQGRFGKAQVLIGRVIKGPMFKGEVVLASKLAPKGAAGGLSAVVPPGYRAMTVKVNEVIGVGGFVQPGDRVDVLATIDQGPFRSDPVSHCVLEDITVLTVGEKIQRESKGGRAKQHKVKVVTLQLKPAQAEILALASMEGQVVLSLRNQADREGGGGRGISLTELAPALAAKKPAPAQKKSSSSPQSEVIELIRGVKRTQQTL